MNIVVAEDSVLLREGLVFLLHDLGHSVVGSVGSANEFTDLIDSVDADLAIVDIRMPPTFTDDGLRAAIAARKKHPTLAVLVLSQYIEDSYALELLADGHGGIGYLIKDRVQDSVSFAKVVEEVGSGGRVIDPGAVHQLLRQQQASGALDQLTPRELEVLAHMARGKDNTEIAGDLFVTDRAVLKHVGSIFSKLQLRGDDGTHRRVRAVLTYLESTRQDS